MQEDHERAGRLPALPLVDVYHAADGCPVVDVDTAGSGPDAHDDRDDPYVRVAVNDGYVHEHSPAEPFAGSRDALGLNDGPGPDDQHHSTADLEDALRIALVLGVDSTADPALFPQLQQRGLIIVEVGPGAHQVALRTAAGDALLRRLVPELADAHPQL